MPETTRDIKRRIKSIKNTQQITKAMEMVAAARLRRAQEKVAANEPYITEIRRLLGGLLTTFEEVKHPFLAPRERNSVGYVVLTSDRGLCGSFNAHVLRTVHSQIDAEENEANLVAVGRKGRDYFKRRDYKLLAEFLNIGDDPAISLAREMTRSLVGIFEQGLLDEINLVYMEFFSVGRQRPAVTRLLPVAFTAAEGEEEQEKIGDYIIEPDVKTFLNMVLPRYLEAQLYHVLLQSKASEHAARMMAMGHATENASDMIKQLTLSFNKARQAAITKEITEIVGGAEALRKTTS